MCRGSMYASKLACAMLPAITVPTASGEIPDRVNTSRATLIPRSIGDTSPSAVPYSANGVRTPSINHTSSYCEIRPLVCLAISSQLPAVFATAILTFNFTALGCRNCVVQTFDARIPATGSGPRYRTLEPGRTDDQLHYRQRVLRIAL